MSLRSVTEIRVFETPWSDLPASVRSAFRESEGTAYAKGAICFKELAKQSGERLLIALFDLLRDNQPMWAYVEAENDEAPLIWFGFSFVKLHKHPQFRISSDQKPPIPLPGRLDKLYSAFGGIRLTQADAGGVLPPEKMLSLGQYLNGPPADLPIDKDQYFTILSYGNGDYLCLNANGHCITFDHETGAINEADLDAALDDFLQDMLRKPDLGAMFGRE